jgi:CBS domain-containing protein
MRVKDVMSSPVVTVTPLTRLKQAAALLVRHGFNALPVVDEGQLVGIVTEADLISLQASPDRRAHALPQAEPAGDPPRVVRDVMAREVVALPEDDDAAEAARLMLARGIKSIPIVSGRRVIGIVSRRDLLKVLARSDQAIRTDVERLLGDELGGESRGVEVADGVVTLAGFDDPGGRQLADLLASTVPGVIRVRFAPTA